MTIGLMVILQFLSVAQFVNHRGLDFEMSATNNLLPLDNHKSQKRIVRTKNKK